jgi:hypothetical protein
MPVFQNSFGNVGGNFGNLVKALLSLEIIVFLVDRSQIIKLPQYFVS